MELDSNQLRNPAAFQLACMEKLNILPTMPTAINWAKTVQEMLADVQEIEAPEDAASPEGQFWEYVEAFCTSRIRALTLEEILLGKPYTADGKHYFRTGDLFAFLQRKGFREFRIQQVTKALTMRRNPDNTAFAHKENTRINGRLYILWVLPEYRRYDASLIVPEQGDKF